MFSVVAISTLAVAGSARVKAIYWQSNSKERYMGYPAYIFVVNNNGSNIPLITGAKNRGFQDGYPTVILGQELMLDDYKDRAEVNISGNAYHLAVKAKNGNRLDCGIFTKGTDDMVVTRRQMGTLQDSRTYGRNYCWCDILIEGRITNTKTRFVTFHAKSGKNYADIAGEEFEKSLKEVLTFEPPPVVIIGCDANWGEASASKLGEKCGYKLVLYKYGDDKMSGKSLMRALVFTKDEPGVSVVAEDGPITAEGHATLKLWITKKP
jgi:hypothetical protein